MWQQKQLLCAHLPQFQWFWALAMANESFFINFTNISSQKFRVRNKRFGLHFQWSVCMRAGRCHCAYAKILFNKLFIVREKNAIGRKQYQLAVGLIVPSFEPHFTRYATVWYTAHRFRCTDCKSLKKKKQTKFQPVILKFSCKCQIKIGIRPIWLPFWKLPEHPIKMHKIFDLNLHKVWPKCNLIDS